MPVDPTQRPGSIRGSEPDPPGVHSIGKGPPREHPAIAVDATNPAEPDGAEENEFQIPIG